MLPFQMVDETKLEMIFLFLKKVEYSFHIICLYIMGHCGKF